MTNPYQAPSGDGAARRARIDPATASEIEARIANLNSRSLTFGAIGLGLQVYGRIRADVVGLVIILAGTALLIYGLSLYAAMRGQPRVWGLMGLLSCIGLIVLALLPKRCHYCGARTTASQCDQCGAPAPK